MVLIRVLEGKSFGKVIAEGIVFYRFGIAFFEICSLLFLRPPDWCKICFDTKFKCFTLRVWAGKRFAKEMLEGTVFGRFGIAFFEICTLFCIQNFAFLKSYCLEKKCFESNFKCFNSCLGRAKFCKGNC